MRTIKLQKNKIGHMNNSTTPQATSLQRTSKSLWFKLIMMVLALFSFERSQAQCTSMSIGLTAPSWSGLEFCTGYNPSTFGTPSITYTGLCLNTPNYQYAWQQRVNGGAWTNLSSGTSPSVPSYDPVTQNNTPAGTAIRLVEFRLVVTDIANGNLSATASNYSIYIGSNLTASTVSTMSCSAPVNGAINLTVNGGTSGKTYLWTTGGSGSIPSGQQIVEDPSGLTAGTYTVAITDAACASITATSSVSSAGNLTASISGSTNVACFGDNTGTATVTPSGGAPIGSPTYSYSWAASGGTGSTANSLAAGTYTVQVTDGGGCIVTTTVTITQPATGLTVSGSVTSNYNGAQLSCFGSSDGSISVSGSGGTGSIEYKIDGGAYQSGTSFSALAAGVHTVTARDASLCTATTTVTITAPTLLTASSVQGAAIACNGGTTTVTVSGSGGTPPYTGEGTFTVGAGTHNYTVTDANGCTANTSITISEPTLLTASSVQGAANDCNRGTT
ncbi:MAG: SprB repeat-containing protein [Chitinophagaceae bacterium]|nr:SprB repeat-containing protein [Chitinophagaceae bacterium]